MSKWNVEVLQRMRKETENRNNIKGRKIEYFGHVLILIEYQPGQDRTQMWIRPKKNILAKNKLTLD